MKHHKMDSRLLRKCGIPTILIRYFPFLGDLRNILVSVEFSDGPRIFQNFTEVFSFFLWFVVILND